MQNIFDGLKVIDFTNNAAGPVSTALLADFGAEVIKIERPKVGDDVRAYAPRIDGTAVSFFWLNRGKKSLVLDIKDPQGLEIVKKLIATADVVVESFKPGVMKKYGLTYEELREINPKLIMCSVSAFGQTGPYSHRPGYDVVAQALSGVMDVTGEIDGPPIRTGITLADYNAGVHAYSAITSALYHRVNTGIGQYIDIAMLDCLVAINMFVEHASLGNQCTRSGNHHGTLIPFGLFNGNNESAIIAAPNPKLWSQLCQVMGKQKMENDPKYNTSVARNQNRSQVVEVIETWLKSFTSIKEPLDILEKAGIPCGKVNTVADLLEDEQLCARDMITDMEMPDGMSVKSIKARGNPLKFSEVKAVIKKPPKLGEHQAEVLRLIGYDEASIAALKDKWSVS